MTSRSSASSRVLLLVVAIRDTQGRSLNTSGTATVRPKYEADFIRSSQLEDLRSVPPANITMYKLAICLALLGSACAQVQSPVSAAASPAGLTPLAGTVSASASASSTATVTIDTTGGCFESKICITSGGDLFMHMSPFAQQLLFLLQPAAAVSYSC